MNITALDFGKSFIALAVGILLSYALVVTTHDVQSQVPPLPSSIYDKRLDELHKEAVEQAYRNRITSLFEIWMKDPTGQPDRATTGARQARVAFIAVMSELDRRK